MATNPGGWRAIVFLLPAMTGCAGYMVGSRTLYPVDVETVYVPMVENDTFRRNLGERLTEAIVKEIESKGHLKVVGTPDADSILTVRLTSERKRTLIESPTDEGREVQLDLQAEIAWQDRRGELIGRPQSLPLSPDLVGIGQASTLVPEVGQSIATAHQKAIQDLAAQIVELMEMPW
jgi:hypothetical protein